jgi:hypothetical protein
MIREATIAGPIPAVERPFPARPQVCGTRTPGIVAH